MIAPQSIDSVLLLRQPNGAQWRSIVEAMKPGAHLLLLSSVKEHHVGTMAAEDAGLEIRDTLAYVFANSENGGSKVEMQLIAMARKPLQGTVAENVLRWGTGGLNVDGCRVEGAPPSVPQPLFNSPTGRTYGMKTGEGRNGDVSQASGRWPANVITDGSDEVVGLFPQTVSGAGDKHSKTQDGNIFKGLAPVSGLRSYQADSGSAARFFYSAPCLNDLCSYLIKLVTPLSGTILTDYDTTTLPSNYNYVTKC